MVIVKNSEPVPIHDEYLRLLEPVYRAVIHSRQPNVNIPAEVPLDNLRVWWFSLPSSLKDRI
jgi:hypothetical protein